MAILAAASSPARAQDRSSPNLGLPVDCRLGEDCFVQQMPDVDPSEQAVDPLCGNATYQGHDGWDIRIRTLKDIERGTPVIAIADGTITRARDGIPDRIYDRAHDMDAAGKECGNGLLVEHADGLVSQYCHLKEGSLVVRPGARVKKGDRLGSIGASGLAEFPHVHLSVRRDGKPTEPLTGRPLGLGRESCGETGAGLFEPAVRDALSRSPSAILLVGLANAPPELSSLVRNGEPPGPKTFEPVVAWVWAINVESESFFRLRLVDPDGRTMMNVETKSLERRKANYLAYAGGKLAQREGEYGLQVDLISGSKTIWSTTRSILIGQGER
ncbi:M23 family metallopeptidase [Bradyrhizobium sp. SSUT77]|uniref:M23 family metallopeptidase n=1 Tax=Bradyrhizobium sp. SSUT77 TaxID=3040603 RepID=UPI0024480833|nr:M23 family metallopeptidase [Bradyrhizobium sp. SSUT77]MDH2348631.1 M23 family metallopeptidase [Bradyrhizobium sp. SSUT77]